MSRIQKTFAAKKAAGQAAFMPYVVAGDPDLDTSRRIILALAEAGADLIELGVPFSDPMADGPTNQLAAGRALAAGTTLKKVLALVKDVRCETNIPLLLMGYYNPFFCYGMEAFCADAAEAGVDGLIIPDLQPDDAAEVRPYATNAGLDTIFLVAPTSPPERMKRVAEVGSGFVYAVSLTGVTGARSELPPELAGFIANIRKHIDLPIAVGFGISTPAMAREVGRLADGVIVGSALVSRIAEGVETGGDPVPAVAAVASELIAALTMT